MSKTTVRYYEKDPGGTYAYAGEKAVAAGLFGMTSAMGSAAAGPDGVRRSLKRTMYDGHTLIIDSEDFAALGL